MAPYAYILLGVQIGFLLFVALDYIMDNRAEKRNNINDDRKMIHVQGLAVAVADKNGKVFFPDGHLGETVQTILETGLSKALESENYEEAARIRDLMNKK